MNIEQVSMLRILIFFKDSGMLLNWQLCTNSKSKTSNIYQGVFSVGIKQLLLPYSFNVKIDEAM